MGEDTENVAKERLKIEAILITFSIVYISYFTNLGYFYDWDTITRAIWLKDGIYCMDTGVTHFLISILAGALVYFGLDALNAFRFFTAIFMLVFVFGTYKFAYAESRDSSLSLLMAFFILFNFGFTFLTTTLEDNIWMYAMLISFVYFLLQERWVISALFLSFSMLMHVQAEVFIPMFLGYMLLKLDIPSFFENGKSPIQNLRKLISTQQMQKVVVALICFTTPLLVAYSYLVLLRGWKLNNFIENFTASGPAYHGDPRLWYFATNRSLHDQLQMAYYGYVSTFVCRYPDFLQSMPKAVFFGSILGILIIFVLARSISMSLKILCAIPTFLVLFLHALIFEPSNLERWDFMPFFVMYFVAVGYNAIKEGEKKQLKRIFELIVIISAMFTFASFNSLSGFQQSAVCAYGDKLSELLDNQSVILETTLKPTSSYGRYLIYKCGKNIIFPEQERELQINFTGKKVYSSYATYLSPPKITPKTLLDAETIWTNKRNNKFSLVRLRAKGI